MELAFLILRITFTILQAIFSVIMFIDIKKDNVWRAFKHYAISNLFFTLSMLLYIIGVQLWS